MFTTSTDTVENVVRPPQNPMPAPSCSTSRAPGCVHSSASTIPRSTEPTTFTTNTGHGNVPPGNAVRTAQRVPAPATPPTAIAIAAAFRRPSPNPGIRSSWPTSARDPVTQGDDAAREPALVDERGGDPGVAGQRGLAAADRHRREHQQDLVDQPGPERLPGQLRPAHGQVGAGRRLQPAHGVGVETA